MISVVTNEHSSLQSASVFTFVLEEIVDVLVQLMVEGDVDDVAGGRVAGVRLLSDTE